MKHEHPGSYELVVDTSCLGLLSEKLHEFKSTVDYDPFEPTQEDVRIHGSSKARERARINTLSNAAEATRNGWGNGPAECYRRTIEKTGLGTKLQRAILNWDIQVSYFFFFQHVC